jgi:hypothetical protein
MAWRRKNNLTFQVVYCTLMLYSFFIEPLVNWFHGFFSLEFTRLALCPFAQNLGETGGGGGRWLTRVPLPALPEALL